MLTFEQMVLRLLVALALGAFIGLEREMVGKEAGIRTAMLVSSGAAIFSMISIMMPYVSGVDPAKLVNVLPDRVISNIVVGIGFLGAGIIIKVGEHVRGLTTAAVVWLTAAVGSLVGIGLMEFAVVAALMVSGPLYLLRKIDLYKIIRKGNGENGNGSEQT